MNAKNLRWEVASYATSPDYWGDCSEKCSFIRFKNGEYCPEQCFLPKWFTDIIDKIMRGGYYPFLEEIKDAD